MRYAFGHSAILLLQLLLHVHVMRCRNVWLLTCTDFEVTELSCQIPLLDTDWYLRIVVRRQILQTVYNKKACSCLARLQGFVQVPQHNVHINAPRPHTIRQTLVSDSLPDAVQGFVLLHWLLLC